MVTVSSGDFAYFNDITPIEKHGLMWLKRDDLYRAAGAPGGKARTCWMLAQGAAGLVAASHRFSPQMIMTSQIAEYLGIPCRIHTAIGDHTPEMKFAVAHGAVLIQHSPGYNGVIIKRARDDAAALGWREIPFGMESSEAIQFTADQVKAIPKGVERIVISVGIGMSLSGVLWGLRRLKSRSTIPVLAIAVGTPHPEKFIDRWAPDDWRDQVQLIHAEEDYSTHVHEEWHGVLLDPVYEAKTVRYLERGDLLWIVGIRSNAGEK